jgi:hypothetical protein
MVHIALVGFLPCGNGQSCDMHPFGCGNLLVLNQEDYGVGMLLRLQMMVPNELSCYTINSDGSDGWRVCFVAREYTAGEKMDVSWMDTPYASLMCLHAMMPTA